MSLSVTRRVESLAARLSSDARISKRLAHVLVADDADGDPHVRGRHEVPFLHKLLDRLPHRDFAYLKFFREARDGQAAAGGDAALNDLIAQFVIDLLFFRPVFFHTMFFLKIYFSKI